MFWAESLECTNYRKLDIKSNYTRYAETEEERSTRSRSQDNKIVNLGINQFGAFSLACITEKIHFDRMSTLCGVQIQTHSFIKRKNRETLPREVSLRKKVWKIIKALWDYLITITIIYLSCTQGTNVNVHGTSTLALLVYPLLICPQCPMENNNVM